MQVNCACRGRMLVLDDARCSKFLDWLGGPQVTGGAELPAGHSAELGPAPTKQDTNPRRFEHDANRRARSCWLHPWGAEMTALRPYICL